MVRQGQDIANEQLSSQTGFACLEDVMQHMEQMENVTLPDVSLIDEQNEIKWYMRPILIDFLIEVHGVLDLLPQTLFLSVNILDRYCSRRVVYKRHYQLLGCTALFIAAKCVDEKNRVPQISQLHDLCDGLYQTTMFTQMEIHVLNTLDWIVSHPTVDFFCQMMVVEEGYDQEVAHMAAYLCEVALYHREFVSAKPSIVSRCSLRLARAILGRIQLLDG
ncbi:unnamed protein product, partial [Fusarium langsethiae]